jgi:NADH:ubiquinone oxidoreductase subunit
MIRKLINRLRTLNTPWSNKLFVGHDLQGNMYFEEPMIKRGINFPRRSVIYQDGRNHLSQYDPDSIPVQWQAWMRHTRLDPPTLQELQLDLQRQAVTELNVKKLEEKEKQEMAQIPEVFFSNTGCGRIMDAKTLIFQ